MEGIKTDRTKVGPEIKGHPRYEQELLPLTSLGDLNFSGAPVWAHLYGTDSGRTFFKYLQGICTPARREAEVCRGASSV